MPLNSPKRPPYWNSTSGFDFDHITAVDMSFCTSLQNFILIGPPSGEKWRHVDFQDGGSPLSWILGPTTGSLKSPCTTSYRSSIDTMALNCLVFEKIAFLHFGDRQTDKQMDRPVAWSRSRCCERRFNKLIIAYVINSPFAHHNLFSRMHMGVRNDPSLGPVFSDSFSNTKKLKICTVSIMYSQPYTYNS